MNIEVVLVNAFTVNSKGGNPAGVVLNSDSLSEKQKLLIAQEVGYSETAFVSHGEEADFHVSFFTTTGEVDFCGHATLATFATLYQKGVITPGSYTQKTKAGLLAVNVEENGQVIMQQTLPKYLGTFDYATISPFIGIDAIQLATTQLPIEVVSTGLSDVIVPVPTGMLEQLQIDERGLSDFCQKHQLVGIHAFELSLEHDDITASCRNFAPLYGIPEESATGSACGALACYLTKHIYRSTHNHFRFEQGRVMNCTSHITATIEQQDQLITQQVLVGGAASVIGVKTIDLTI
ncbi:PhzF family phenazine biosynthesis isomerase [Vibrio sp. CAIM 722]|uniref:PhzF family phenazine biosynthesis isomerase n=1 Tax=Vibrio eleionomae TaxID=2653505 RepID=A0A7X4LJN6_9VIBR|nr:PhzF family phenazine biosynthesis isomerase [Vibrio eleionomae]